jgi:hypothetical protein
LETYRFGTANAKLLAPYIVYNNDGSVAPYRRALPDDWSNMDPESRYTWFFENRLKGWYSIDLRGSFNNPTIKLKWTGKGSDASIVWHPSGGVLNIDPEYWDALDRAGRRRVIFHELEHVVDQVSMSLFEDPMPLIPVRTRSVQEPLYTTAFSEHCLPRIVQQMELARKNKRKYGDKAKEGEFIIGYLDERILRALQLEYGKKTAEQRAEVKQFMSRGDPIDDYDYLEHVTGKVRQLCQLKKELTSAIISVRNATLTFDLYSKSGAAAFSSFALKIKEITSSFNARQLLYLCCDDIDATAAAIAQMAKADVKNKNLA